MNIRLTIDRVSRTGFRGRMATPRYNITEHDWERIYERLEATLREAIGHPAPVTVSPPTYRFLRN